MRDTSRFIPGESIALATPWDFGAVGGDAILLPSRQDAKEDDATKAQAAFIKAAANAARAEGFADGFAQGHAKATVEAQHQINEFTRTQGRDAAQRFVALAESLEQEVDEGRETLAQGILELASELARTMVHHEVKANPLVLLPIVRAGVAQLKDEAKPVIIRLNPRDLEALKEPLLAEFPALSLTLVADTHIEPAGCRIESAGTQVDATTTSRWARAMAALGQTTLWEDSTRDD